MENNNSWYGISNRFIALVLKNEDGELTPEEYQEQGNELALELKNKGVSTQGYILQQEAEIEAVKEQIKRLQDYCKAREKRVEKIKSCVKDALEKLGISKLETSIGTISIANNPASVEVYDESLIPAKYIVEKITKSPDKKAIKEALKNGENIQGFTLVEGKTSLRIK